MPIDSIGESMGRLGNHGGFLPGRSMILSIGTIRDSLISRGNLSLARRLHSFASSYSLCLFVFWDWGHFRDHSRRLQSNDCAINSQIHILRTSPIDVRKIEADFALLLLSNYVLLYPPLSRAPAEVRVKLYRDIAIINKS